MAHQLQGIVRCLCSNQAQTSSVETFAYPIGDRQPYSCGHSYIHKYINRGGTKSMKLLNLTRQLLALLDCLNVSLTVRFLLRWYIINPECHLLPTATGKNFCTPKVDLFASKTAHVVPTYAFIDSQDRRALLNNAFLHCYNYSLG